MARRMTPKQKAYVRNIAAGMTKKQAVLLAYDHKPDVLPNSLTAHAAAVEKNPLVLAALEALNEEAQESLKSVLRASTRFAQDGTRDGASYAQVAEKAANSILDRIHGKAKQSLDISSNVVSINIDLSADDVIDV